MLSVDPPLQLAPDCVLADGEPNGEHFTDETLKAQGVALPGVCVADSAFSGKKNVIMRNHV